MPTVNPRYWHHLGDSVYCLQDIADKIFRDAFAFGSEGLCVLLQLTSFDENTIIDRTVPCIRECKLKVPGHKSETQFQFVFILRNDGKLFITHAIDLSREDQIDALSLTDDARALAQKIATGEMA